VHRVAKEVADRKKGEERREGIRERVQRQRMQSIVANNKADQASAVGLA
jgi:hypothetical protein